MPRKTDHGTDGNGAGPALTPVEAHGGWWAKREDAAGYAGPDYPSGSKVRQYARMVAVAPPDAVLLVGCSADSCMGVYVAAAGRLTGLPAVVFTPARADPPPAVTYARALGATVHEVRPGYLSVVRARAREHGKAAGRPVVRWDVAGAVADAAAQTANLPAAVRRVVVPTGSGLTAAGVAAGLGAAGRAGVAVLAVAVSDMATAGGIETAARRAWAGPLPAVRVERAPGPYGRWVYAVLPDGAYLDPYYAAKALPFVRAGDCLWVPGRRPLAACPAEFGELVRAAGGPK